MAFATYVGETKNKKGNYYMKFSFLTIETFLLFLGFFLGCAEIISFVVRNDCFHNRTKMGCWGNEALEKWGIGAPTLQCSSAPTPC
jgi:hypothetical protein